MKFGTVEWDAGNWPKCGRHGVGRDEIEDLILGDSFKYFPDAAHSTGEERWIGIGRSAKTDHWMLVIFAMRGLDDEPRARPISARYMHAKEVRRYVNDDD